MRRLLTTLSLLTLVLVVAGCGSVFQGVQAVINAPGVAVTAIRGPGDTIGFPIRYETRPGVEQELLLQADGTYFVRNLKDSIVVDTGHYTLIFGQFTAHDCKMQLGPVWLKGGCFGKAHMMWRESPQNLHWPPQAPKPQKQTAFIQGDPRLFGIVTVPS